uniref:Cyclin-dependent kinase inhibitor domain-containing protein n=1 Tax=Anoplophora glabripennis TaxID=217634 RepID=V5G5E5_ANOGL
MSISIHNPLGLTLCSRMPNSMFLYNNREVRKVKRVLFGPSDDIATKKFVQEELSKIAVIQSEKWNFDFKREQTLDPNGQYQWRPATPQKTVRPVKTRPTPEDDIQEELYGEPGEVIRPTPVRMIEEEEMKPPKPTHKARNQNQKPQSLITDFMVEKKRSTSDPTKKPDWAPMERPAKVPRLHDTTS